LLWRSCEMDTRFTGVVAASSWTAAVGIPATTNAACTVPSLRDSAACLKSRYCGVILSQSPATLNIISASTAVPLSAAPTATILPSRSFRDLIPLSSSHDNLYYLRVQYSYSPDHLNPAPFEHVYPLVCVERYIILYEY
jgi:hypothetical protein